MGGMIPFVTSPEPSPTELDLTKPWVVSPGIEGFAMFAILGLAVALLIWSMTRHIRKANFRAAEREEALYGPADLAVGPPSHEPIGASELDLPEPEITEPGAAPAGETTDDDAR